MNRTVHFFNPGHETAVLNESIYYMAPANVVCMQLELAFLPAWYAQENSTVLIKRQDDYISYLKDLFPSLANSTTENEIIKYSDTEISLWGISPQVIHYFEELNQKYSLNLKIPSWNTKYSYLNSRKNAKDCLEEIVSQISQIEKEIIPQFFTQLEEIDSEVKNSKKKLLAKAPFSSSGRGLLWLPETGLTRTENQILHGILKKQGSVSIERVVEKDTDFAMEFYSDGLGNVNFAGYSLFSTNSKGAYDGNILASQEFIVDNLCDKVSLILLDEVKETLSKILANRCADFYKGCIGVDMMIYRSEGVYKLHPCVEINMRYNMGYLSLKLFENYIENNAKGKFMIDFHPVKGKVYETHCDMLERFPLTVENEEIVKGYLSLCPVLEDTRYRAYILID